MHLSLKEDEVYISSAYAEKFGLQKGDTITLKEKYEEMLSTMNTTVETIRANRKELPKAEDVIISAAPADTAEEEQSEEE